MNLVRRLRGTVPQIALAQCNIKAATVLHQPKRSFLGKSKLSAWVNDKVALPEFVREAIQVKSSTNIEQHELTLLDQEYKLAFAYCDRKRTSTVDAKQLEDALVYFSLANDRASLHKFLRNAADASGAQMQQGTQVVKSSMHDGTRSQREPQDSPNESHLQDGSVSPIPIQQPDANMRDTVSISGIIQFEVFCDMLTESTIRDLKPASLRLDSDDFDESIRGKRWSEIPLRDNLIGLGRRIQQEGLHYMRGVKLAGQQFGQAFKVVRREANKLLEGGGIQGMSRAEKRLLTTVVLDFVRMVPAIVLVAIPGGSLVLVTQSRILPQSLPTTFQVGYFIPYILRRSSVTSCESSRRIASTRKTLTTAGALLWGTPARRGN
eukprot:m.902174 g.902174  ORF g.902174 m.902174 type:complete len:378 (-) comp23689_c3_seq37:1487-2620(-)